MHEYATDVERRVLMGVMGIAALALAIAGNRVINLFIQSYLFPILPNSVSDAILDSSLFVTAMLAFTVVFIIYNGFMWRFVTRFGKGESTPDLQGTWLRVPEDESITSLQEQIPEIRKNGGLFDQPQLVIGQTWTDIELGYYNPDTSYWRSDSAMIRTLDAPHPELICTYQYEPLNNNSNKITFDRGTLRLRLLPGDPPRLIGTAYADSGHTERGIQFVRVEKSFLPRTIDVDDD